MTYRMRGSDIGESGLVGGTGSCRLRRLGRLEHDPDVVAPRDDCVLPLDVVPEDAVLRERAELARGDEDVAGAARAEALELREHRAVLARRLEAPGLDALELGRRLRPADD